MNDGVGIERRLLKGRQCPFVARVPKHQRGIAHQPLTFRTPEGRAAKTPAELGIRQRDKFHRVKRFQVRPRLQVRFAAPRRLAVPRAHLLAHVAAEQPVADSGPQFVRDRAAQLDGQVADAAPRVELIGRDERVGRTGVQARGAGAAVVGREGRVGLEREIEQQGAEEEIAAQLLVDQHRVLAEPAQAGPAGEVALQQRGRVHDASALRARDLGLHPGQQFVQLGAKHVVIIPAAGVAGDPWAAARRRFAVIVHAHHDHAANAGQDRLRMPARRGLSVQVAHVPSKSLVQPRGKPIKAVGLYGRRNTDQFEPNPAGTLLEAMFNGDVGHATIIPVTGNSFVTARLDNPQARPSELSFPGPATSRSQLAWRLRACASSPAN